MTELLREGGTRREPTHNLFYPLQSPEVGLGRDEIQPSPKTPPTGPRQSG
jgi:hypothetical protein